MRSWCWRLFYLALRFSLMNRLERLGIPARSHRPSRGLRDEPPTTGSDVAAARALRSGPPALAVSMSRMRCWQGVDEWIFRAAPRTWFIVYWPKDGVPQGSRRGRRSTPICASVSATCWAVVSTRSGCGFPTTPARPSSHWEPFPQPAFWRSNLFSQRGPRLPRRLRCRPRRLQSRRVSPEVSPGILAKLFLPPLPPLTTFRTQGLHTQAGPRPHAHLLLAPCLAQHPGPWLAGSEDRQGRSRSGPRSPKNHWARNTWNWSRTV